jgi:hypothetical protein
MGNVAFHQHDEALTETLIDCIQCIIVPIERHWTQAKRILASHREPPIQVKLTAIITSLAVASLAAEMRPLLAKRSTRFSCILFFRIRTRNRLR